MAIIIRSSKVSNPKVKTISLITFQILNHFKSGGSMLKYIQFFLLIAIVFVYANFTQTFSQSKQTTIEAINGNPSSFEAVEVEFVGLVTQYFSDKGTTNYYLIKGDYGGIIRVNTAEPAPETNVKYRVRGIVYFDAKNNRVFVSEKSKYTIEFPDPILSVSPNSIKENETSTLSWSAENAVKVTINGSPVETKGSKTITSKDATLFTLQAQYPDGKFKEKSVTITFIQQSNTLLYILVAALVVLIGAFIYFQMKKRNSENEYSPSSTDQDQNPQAQQPKGFPAHENVEDKPMYTSENEYKTIKIVRTSPKTLKFIPGKLIITDGPDKGKEFRVAGFPTPEGFIVSIGRKEVDGDRAYAHIKLNEKTVSRDQAELHYIDHKLYLKNLSETNFTQLNGSEIKPGKIAEVSSGSTIRAGEVEFKYVV